MKQEYIIKKNIFGGFNRSDVINCLANLTEQNESIKHSELNALRNKIEELNNEIKQKNKTISDFASGNNINKLKAENQSVVRNADALLTEAKKEAEQIKNTVKLYVSKRIPEAQNIIEKSDSVAVIINRLQNNLSSLSEKLNNFSFENITENNTAEPAEQAHITINTVETVNIEIEESTEVIDIVPEEKSEVEAAIDLVYEEDQSPIRVESPVIEADSTDCFNSIDNFFAEMDKLIAAKKNPEPYLSAINENPIEHLE